MQIKTVSTKNDLDTFIQFPYQFYRSDPVWIPPLKDDQLGQFDPVRNPFLEHCTRKLFLLKDGGQVIGRIAAFIDHLAVDYWKEPVGLFGYYECIEDLEASGLLLRAARDWLLEHDMTVMRGPWSFVSQEWGAVVDGYTPSPCVMAPYNPPYYNDHFAEFGLTKVKDLLVYSINADEGYQIPERIIQLTDKVRQRYGIKIRQIDMKHLDEEVETIMSLSNSSIADNWGYSPVTDAEVAAMAHDLKPVIQPKGVLFAEDSSGNPIGFAIVIPDVNTLLKGLNGSLLPFGWAKLMLGIPKLRSYRMFALGVIPEYHGKAIDSLLYRALYESLFAPDLRMEINYVLEDNYRMNNAIEKLGAKPMRRYRIYETPIGSSD